MGALAILGGSLICAFTGIGIYTVLKWIAEHRKVNRTKKGLK